MNSIQPRARQSRLMKSVQQLWFVAVLVTSTAVSAVGVGERAPVFELPDAAGSNVQSDSLKGRVVYVDFWASWCPPCRLSFPWMNEMTEKYGPKGFKIVAINVDKKREDADKFLAQVPAHFIVAFDATGKTAAAWEVEAMPSCYLVDVTGTVILVETGFKDERKAELERRIRAALEIR